MDELDDIMAVVESLEQIAKVESGVAHFEAGVPPVLGPVVFKALLVVVLVLLVLLLQDIAYGPF